MRAVPCDAQVPVIGGLDNGGTILVERAVAPLNRADALAALTERKLYDLGFTAPNGDLRKPVGTLVMTGLGKGAGQEGACGLVARERYGSPPPSL